MSTHDSHTQYPHPHAERLIQALREIDERGEAAVPATAELMNLPESRVRIALHYYADYPEEIDAEIAQNIAETEEAFRSWKVERRLLS